MGFYDLCSALHVLRLGVFSPTNNKPVDFSGPRQTITINKKDNAAPKDHLCSATKSWVHHLQGGFALLLSLLHPRPAADVALGQFNGNIISRAQATLEQAWPSSTIVPDISRTFATAVFADLRILLLRIKNVERLLRPTPEIPASTSPPQLVTAAGDFFFIVPLESASE
ncbi:hypothetical protein TYRP_018243 [Tyrophagus putrescentiae]|nr:hypothetical protein TYRP_018243 [Tyrophagus putrescentiae]